MFLYKNLEVYILKYQRKNLPSICLKLHNEIPDYFPFEKSTWKSRSVTYHEKYTFYQANSGFHIRIIMRITKCKQENLA